MEDQTDMPIVVGGKAYSEIIVSGPDNEVIAVITGDKIIEQDGYQVMLNAG